MRRRMHTWTAGMAAAAAAWLALGGALAAEGPANPAEVQTAGRRPAVGAEATPYLWFDSGVIPTNFIPLPKGKRTRGEVTNVTVAGSWSSWTGRHAMAKAEGNLWKLDVRNFGARVGRHEYKFIVNGEWEAGGNRVLPINLDGEIERTPEMVQRATVDDFRMIRVFFRESLPEGIEPKASLDPEVPVAWTEVVTELADARKSGYLFAEGVVTFLFDENVYGLKLGRGASVVVAGNFTGWDGGGGWAGQWKMKRAKGEGLWELPVQLDGMRLPAGESELLFKFVVDGKTWLKPPEDAENAVGDGKGNRNLKVDLFHSGGTEIRVHTAADLDLSQNYVLKLEGVREKPIGLQTSPEGVFNRLYSDKPLGAILDKERGRTTYRIFAPRAKNAWLCFYDRAEAVTWTPKWKRFPAAEEYRMRRDENGVWEATTLGLDVGRYYGFRLDGPEGDGEQFDEHTVVGDPYGRAAAGADGLTLVVDPDATNEWFRGWTDADWKRPDGQDVVIYECHVRGMTIHPSSGVDAKLRGKYRGLAATLGKPTGLGHVKAMGANAVELLPVNEFSDGAKGSYDWGYSTVYYFAPESSYASNPTNGSAYYELKQLVDDCHAAGLAVILDVVYNHVGGPNIFASIDKKYYFRLAPDLSYFNYSGCGNDVKTESPMMRRFIVDNIRYFVEEFHVDGFRFDLAELIDMRTMAEIRDAARAIDPNVILISEPWSGRGEQKEQLYGTGWSAWNNDFRYAAKDFALGGADRGWLKHSVFGSVDTWAQNPLQPVNYLESHDDLALADEFSSAPGHDGRTLKENEAAENRLAATVLFTSLGKTMVAEGQEFMRSKWGSGNSYNRGDAVNAIRWGDRERPIARDTMEYYRGLMQLRMSEEGESFRVAQRPPANYYRWIVPANPQLFGYVVNVPEIHNGRGFAVLYNTGDVRAPVPVELGGKTRWRMIGNGRKVDRAGLAPTDWPAGRSIPEWPAGWKGELPIPPKTGVILMNGF